VLHVLVVVNDAVVKVDIEHFVCLIGLESHRRGRRRGILGHQNLLLEPLMQVP